MLSARIPLHRLNDFYCKIKDLGFKTKVFFIVLKRFANEFYFSLIMRIASLIPAPFSPEEME